MTDGFPEYKILQKRLENLEREMTMLRNDVDALCTDTRGFRADLDRLVLMIIGGRGYDGLCQAGGRRRDYR